MDSPEAVAVGVGLTSGVSGLGTLAIGGLLTMIGV